MHKNVWSALVVLFSVLTVLSLSPSAFASETSVLYNGKKIRFDSAPVVADGTALVEARPLAKAFGATAKWSKNTNSVKLTTKKIGVVLKMDYDIMTKSDLNNIEDDSFEQLQLSASPRIINGSAYVPVRDVAKAFGASVDWDPETDSILLSTGGYRYSNEPAASPLIDFKSGSGHTFFFQNQAEWNLPDYGSGYCWTVSYAMLISDVTGENITPVDVAEVNEAKGGSGSYCYHWDIADAFGVEFVPALDEESPYYGGWDSNSGGTRVLNETGDEEVTIDAIKEALDLHPEGVMVRYADYPHTMVAVGYDGDEIYFNEPMRTDSDYLETSSKCNVPFDETCVGMCGISIADLTFMQAIEKA